MKIALLGYGKMGKLVELEAGKQGLTVVARLSRKPDAAQIQEADVCIDFSHADSVVAHAAVAVGAGKNLVIGTTGWEQHLPAVKELADRHGVGILYAPNFSIGVSLFNKILREAAKLMRPFPCYDVSGSEMHHKNKADAPSGTALLLAETLVDGLGRSAPLTFSSVRCGEIPGTHTVIFDSPADTITLTHQARNREGFARGAIEAAKWLQGKKGFYTIEDML